MPQADSTKKYTELQKQMDQMLGMVRNESENVRNLENQIYSNPSIPTVGSTPMGVKMFDSSPNSGMPSNAPKTTGVHG